MAPKFGTSGVRGLVVEMTPELIGAYTQAFLSACDTGTGLLDFLQRIFDLQLFAFCTRGFRRFSHP